MKHLILQSKYAESDMAKVAKSYMYYILSASERHFLESFIPSNYQSIGAINGLLHPENRKEDFIYGKNIQEHSFRSLKIKGYNITCYRRKGLKGTGASVLKKEISNTSDIIDVTILFFLESVDKDGKTSSGVVPLRFYTVPDELGNFTFSPKNTSPFSIVDKYHVIFNNISTCRSGC
jgi:hypothetical protein